MKKLYWLLFTVCLNLTAVFAQPGAIGVNNIDGSPFSCTGLTNRGLYRTAKLLANQNAAAPSWEFPQDCAFPGDVWRPYSSGTAAVPFNVTVPPVPNTPAALYNSNNGGGSGALSAVTSGRYYIFNIENVVAPNNAFMCVMESATNPLAITAVTRTPAGSAISSSTAVQVTVTVAGTTAPPESVFVRFTTNSYAASTIVPVVFSGNTGVATIPAQAAGANVSFYVYSSTKSKSAIDAEVGLHGQVVHDMSTLEWNTNSGANYTYNVSTSSNPILVTATNSANDGFYPTLKAAFDSINSGFHTGAISVSVIGNTTETATALLEASGTAAASYSSVLISPAGGAARSVSGAIAAGSSLIHLRGADNVTIDGLNAGGNSLTIENTTVSATSGTNTIRLDGDATSNIITRARILGSGTMANGTNGGNIWIGSAAIATGNDNNRITNCEIGPSSAGLNSKGIYINGSTTNITVANSGIVIENNRIFDYFAAANSSAGIDIAGGATEISILGNRFYQTATRTQTTASNHSAIRVSSTSGNGFIIRNNVIGYASDTETGTYTLVGLGSTKFVPIDLSVGTTTTTQVLGNTVTAINFSGPMTGTTSSGVFRGIYVGAGLTEVSQNLVGSMTTTGSITVNLSGTTTADIMGIQNWGSSAWVVTQNQVGGIFVANSSTGAGNIYPIRGFTSSTVTTLCSNNTVGGSVPNSIQSTTTSTSSVINGILFATSILTARENTIQNLTAGGGTGTTTGASVIGFVTTSTLPTTGYVLADNRISGLSNTNPSINSTVAGIQFTGPTAGNRIERNLIFGLNNASPTGIVNGINVSGGTSTYVNNMIRLGKTAAGVDITTGAAFNGINGPLGTDNFYHNSVLIDGAGVTDASNTFAFNSSQTVNTRNFRNNIFFNARSNGSGTGKHYAIRVGGTSANPAGLTSDYNILFVNGTGGVLGLFNAVDRTSLADWQTATGQDANSLNVDPLFVSATDLNLQSGSPARNAAVDIATVVDDFNRDSRPGANSVKDIGADEFDGTPAVTNDAQPTAFIAPSNSDSRPANIAIPIQVRVTNNGINALTNIPVRYRITDPSSALVYNETATIASLTSSSNTVVNFALPFTPTAFGTYAIEAITELAGDAVVTNDTLRGTFAVLAPLSGPYTVGSGGNYPSLTNNGGIFQALNNLGVSGDITINIISDLTGETGTHALNQYAQAFKTLIRPFGAPRSVTGSSAAAMIPFNGADDVTIDGSVSGATAAAQLVGGDASLRQLTFTNENTGTSAVVINFASGTNGARRNVVKNTIVSGVSPTTSLLGIAFGGSTPGTAGLRNDSNRVENNAVRRSTFGIYFGGSSAAIPDTANAIVQNDLNSTGVDRIDRIGMFVVNQDTIYISRNRIGGITSGFAGDVIGIAVGTQSADLTSTSQGGISRAWVEKNRITGVVSTSTTGFSAVGITLAASSNTGVFNRIENNMISGISAPATSPDLVSGIHVVGVSTGSQRIANNSIALSGDRGTVTAQMPSYGISITGPTTRTEVVNNSVYSTQFASGTASIRTYAIGTAGTIAASGYTGNYNNFFLAGPNPGGFRSGGLGATATDYATLGAWQAAATSDANSLTVDPLYIDTLTDLHIASNSPLIGAGIALSNITQDLDSDIRPSAPAIGADEFTNPIPVRIEYIRGQRQGNNHFLNWKVVCISSPRATMILERSADGRNFNSIYSITADAVRCLQPFDFTDRQTLAGKNYYRLRMIDSDGVTTYSMVVLLINRDNGFELVNLLPNLVDGGNAVLNVSAAKAAPMEVQVTDMTGKVMGRYRYNLIAGSNQFSLDFSRFAAGMYQLTAYTEGHEPKMLRFVKK